MVKFSKPLNHEDMRITTDFHDPKRPSHSGIDFGNNSDGKPIYAVANGYVIYSNISGGYGNTIVIKHNDGTSTLYAHMKNISNYKVGDYVKQNSIIGYVGNTGNSRGSHLHFERIDKEGTESIEKYSGNGKLGLFPKQNRINPHTIIDNKTGYFIWRSEKDNNVCKECASRDGKIFEYGKDIEPPLHHNCRCYIEDIDKSSYDYNYISTSKHFDKALNELKQILDDDK